MLNYDQTYMFVNFKYPRECIQVFIEGEAVLIIRKLVNMRSDFFSLLLCEPMQNHGFT